MKGVVGEASNTTRRCHLQEIPKFVLRYEYHQIYVSAQNSCFIAPLLSRLSIFDTPPEERLICR
jgi:hypothetical protein